MTVLSFSLHKQKNRSLIALCSWCGAAAHARHSRARYRRFADFEHDDYLSVRDSTSETTSVSDFVQFVLIDWFTLCVGSLFLREKTPMTYSTVMKRIMDQQVLQFGNVEKVNMFLVLQFRAWLIRIQSTPIDAQMVGKKAESISTKE